MRIMALLFTVFTLGFSLSINSAIADEIKNPTDRQQQLQLKIKNLNLSKEEKIELDKALGDNNAKIKQLEEQLVEAQKKLDNLAESSKIDKKAAGKQIKIIKDISPKIAALRVESISIILKNLSPEQQKKFLSGSR